LVEVVGVDGGRGERPCEPGPEEGSRAWRDPFPAPYRRNVTTLGSRHAKQCPAWSPSQGWTCKSTTLFSSNGSHLFLLGCQNRRSTGRRALYGILAWQRGGDGERGTSCACVLQLHCAARRDLSWPCRQDGGLDPANRRQRAVGAEEQQSSRVESPRQDLSSPRTMPSELDGMPTAHWRRTLWYRQQPYAPPGP
jgi:hypothetical protein